MLWGRRRARVAVVAAVSAAALLLSGCSAHLDAGSAGANKLEAELGKIEGVRSVYTDGQNNLPFAGTASATVFTDDDLSDEKLQQVTDDVGRWVTSHRGSVTYSASIDSDGFDFTVADRQAANKKTLAVVNGLRGDNRWLGAAIDGNNDSYSIDLQPKSPADLLAAWTAVQAAAAKSGWSGTDVSASAWNKPERTTMLRYRPDFSVTGKDPSAEITAYQAVAGLLLLASATLTGFVQHAVAETRRDFVVSSSMLILPVFAFIASVAGATHTSVRTAGWAALVGAAFDVLRRAARRAAAARATRVVVPVAHRRRSGAEPPLRRIEQVVPTGTCPSDSGDSPVERTDPQPRPTVPDPCGGSRR